MICVGKAGKEKCKKWGPVVSNGGKGGGRREKRGAKRVALGGGHILVSEKYNKSKTANGFRHIHNRSISFFWGEKVRGRWERRKLQCLAYREGEMPPDLSAINFHKRKEKEGDRPEKVAGKKVTVKETAATALKKQSSWLIIAHKGDSDKKKGCQGKTL